jgi:glycosyltransferase involved in cell wall biosynthesis
MKRFRTGGRMNNKLTILAAPAEGGTLSNKKYAIGYNLMYSLSQEFGVKFHAITNFNNLKKKLDNVEIYEIKKELNSVLKRKFIIKYHQAKFAEKIIEKEKIDVIHQMTTFAYKTGFSLIPFFKELSDYPLIMGPVEAPHLIFEDECRGNRAKLFLSQKFFRIATYPLFKKTLEDCDVLIAVNEEVKKLCARHISAEKIKVIPLGIDSSEFQYSPPPDNHDMLIVGNHFKRKGHEYLIKAMPKISREYPDATLHILSDGPKRKFLESLARGLNLGENVIFHGYVSTEELFEFYKNCRVFCHPSLSEGFCHTTLEAMATGRPVVNADNGGSGMVENGKAGFLVPPADSDAIAEAILKMFSDDELTYKMGVEARKKIEEEYDWHKVAERYYEIYREVI